MPFGRYRLIELLGRGGMGEVWRAFDTETQRTVAVKVLPEHLSRDEVFQQRFRREAHAAAGLNSPHVIPIHYYGEIDGRLFVDMRLIEGRDLHAVLANGPLEPGRAVRIIEQVARALQAAHKVGLVHRDVKPSNILLDGDDYAYLIDFGIARAAGETSLTGTGGFVGSWHYMAPERFGAQGADARADVYALACVLYECLTGYTPYPGDSLEQQYAGHVSTPPPRPSNSNPDLSAEFDRVTDKGLAKDPDQRYRSTMELARAAHDATTVPTPRVVPPPPPTEPAPVPVVPPTMPQWSQIPPPTGAAHPDTRPPARSGSARRKRWIIITAVVLAAVTLAAVIVARQLIRSNYYVADYSGTVTIMQGIRGSFLGVSLHEPYLRGCLTAQNELSLVNVGSSGDSGCRAFMVTDLRSSERAQVVAGLPSGGLDEVISQVRALASQSVLPVCASMGTSTPVPSPISPPTTELPGPPQPGIDCRQP